MEYYDRFHNGDIKYRQYFLNCADWFVENGILDEKNKIILLYYNFDWPYYGITKPWPSALAQAEALKVLARAYYLTADSKYQDCSDRMLSAFFVSAKEGGLTYKTEQYGWWYEEYVCQNELEPRPLNGMMLTTLGLYDYWLFTRNNQARFLFDQGVRSLKNRLPQYDRGPYAHYDALGTSSPASYYSLNIRSLGELYEITGEEVFQRYHNKWNGNKEPIFIIELLNAPTKTLVLVFVMNLIVCMAFCTSMFLAYSKLSIYRHTRNTTINS
jgi:hypothetical protein